MQKNIRKMEQAFCEANRISKILFFVGTSLGFIILLTSLICLILSFHQPNLDTLFVVDALYEQAINVLTLFFVFAIALDFFMGRKHIN